MALGACLFFEERGPRETVLGDQGCRGLAALAWSVSLMAVVAEGLRWHPLWPLGCAPPPRLPRPSEAQRPE